MGFFLYIHVGCYLKCLFVSVVYISDISEFSNYFLLYFIYLFRNGMFGE